MSGIDKLSLGTQLDVNGTDNSGIQYLSTDTQKELRQVLPNRMEQNKPGIIDEKTFDEIYGDEDKITDFLRTKCFHEVPLVNKYGYSRGGELSITFPRLPGVKGFEKPRKLVWYDWEEFEDIESKIPVAIGEFKKALGVSQDENVNFVSELSYKGWLGQDKPGIIDKNTFDEIYGDEDKITDFLRTKCFHKVPLVNKYGLRGTEYFIIFPGLPGVKGFEKPRKLEWFVPYGRVFSDVYYNHEEWEKNSSSVEDIATKIFAVIREFKKALGVSQDENVDFVSKLCYRKWEKQHGFIHNQDITCKTSRTFQEITGPCNSGVRYWLKNGDIWNVHSGNFCYDEDDDTGLIQLFLGLSEQM